MHYVSLGRIPRKRHVQFRRPDGGLYAEQLLSSRGFAGASSLLYRLRPPTAVLAVDAGEPVAPERWDAPLAPRHLRAVRLGGGGDIATGRRPLVFNDDLTLSMAMPDGPSPFYRNAEADELIFVHAGHGRLATELGNLEAREGDYLVVPRGVTFRLQPAGPMTLLVLETRAPIEPPRRYLSECGQFLEQAPYCERDVRVPTVLETHDEPGAFEVRVRARGRLQRITVAAHPFDVVGWDGGLYPWALSIHDFEPVTGRLHQPPTVHQTFAADGLAVCSFVPRLFDYHPEAVPAPYHHANVHCDEVLFYSRGEFMSRRGVEAGSITLHPAGLPHGPQPGKVEESLGVRDTRELAVMIDAFRPLALSADAREVEDAEYLRSWLG